MLGFCGSEEICHRDNISLLALRNPPADASAPAPPYQVLDDDPPAQSNGTAALLPALAAAAAFDEVNPGPCTVAQHGAQQLSGGRLRWRPFMWWDDNP